MIGKEPDRVVVLQPGFIGDVILVSPILISLRAAYPRAQLALVVRPEKQRLAKTLQGVDRVLVFDKRGDDSGFLGLAQAASRLEKLDFDLLISPHRSTRTAMLAYLSRIPVRVGFMQGAGRVLYNIRVPLSKNEPCRLEQEFSLLRALGLEPVATRPMISPPGEALDYAKDFLSALRIEPDRCVGLCIGANWATKRWPGVWFARLAAMLVDAGCFPILFGGPDEQGLAGEIQREFDTNVDGTLNSCVGNDLIQAMGLLAACAVVVGGDTGLVHMARGVNTPVIMMYGPTDERLHHHHGNEKVLVADVPCRPCHRHGKARCPKKHHRCMKDILPQTVFSAVMDFLD